MESGACRISLDYLKGILEALEVDILEVWPTDAALAQSTSEHSHCRRIQQFRLDELVTLAGAEGAALFRIDDGKCSVLLWSHLSEFLLDRLSFYLEDGIPYQEGLWQAKEVGLIRYVFFLKANTWPKFVRELADHYLTCWSVYFSSRLWGDSIPPSENDDAAQGG